MQIVYERVAGIDIGKKITAVAVRTPGTQTGVRHKQVRKYNTFYQSLTSMVAWLVAEGVTHVSMEATGVYWRPVFHALCAADGPLEVLLVNAAHVKNMPGRKSDALDAAWLAELTECGLLRGSFLPPRQIAELRVLTRYRKKLIEARISELQRLGKVLEDAGIKIDSVASALTTRSARDMIEALIAGERDPAVLADLAHGRMRSAPGRRTGSTATWAPSSAASIAASASRASQQGAEGCAVGASVSLRARGSDSAYPVRPLRATVLLLDRRHRVRRRKCSRKTSRSRRSSRGSRRWTSVRPSWCAACGCPHEARPGRRLQEVTTYSTMTRSLLRLADRLAELGVTRVVMEATSDYWKPVYYLLEAHGFETWLVNARDVKHLPGRPKTDKLDAVWLCKVAERQMIRPEFRATARRSGGCATSPVTGVIWSRRAPRRSSGWRSCLRTPRSSCRWWPVTSSGSPGGR